MKRKNSNGGGQYFLLALIAAAAALAVNALFFNRIWTAPAVLPLAILLFRKMKTDKEARIERALKLEAAEAFASLAISFRTGYAAERAFLEAEKHLAGIYGRKAPLTEAFARMNAGIRLGKAPAEALAHLAREMGLKELQTFSEVYSLAARSGGNLAETVRGASDGIRRSIELSGEIETHLASKRYEADIMSLMPCGILVYMRLASPGFMDIFDTTMMGLGVMAGALVLYVCAVVWSWHIMKIEV